MNAPRTVAALFCGLPLLVEAASSDRSELSETPAAVTPTVCKNARLDISDAFFDDDRFISNPFLLNCHVTLLVAGTSNTEFDFLSCLDSQGLVKLMVAKFIQNESRQVQLTM